MSYSKLIGNCKDCLYGCRKLEDEDFKGKYRCEYYESQEKRKMSRNEIQDIWKQQ